MFQLVSNIKPERKPWRLTRQAVSEPLVAVFINLLPSRQTQLTVVSQGAGNDKGKIHLTCYTPALVIVDDESLFTETENCYLLPG